MGRILPHLTVQRALVSVASICLSAVKQGALAINVSLSRILNCRDDDSYTSLLLLASKHGWQDARVFNMAIQISHSMTESFAADGKVLPTDDNSQAGRDPDSGGRKDSYVYSKFAWRHKIELGDGADVAFLHVLVEFGKLLVNSVRDRIPEDLNLRPSDCPYGWLAVQHAIHVGFLPGGAGRTPQIHQQLQLRQSFATSLIVMMEILLDAPYHSLDFLESTAWNLTSHGMAANVDSDVYYPSFEAYAAANPVPPPLLQPWHATASTLSVTGWEVAAVPSDTFQSVAYSILRARLLPKQQRVHVDTSSNDDSARGGALFSLALLQLHDATAAEILANVHAAVRMIVGVQEGDATVLKPRLYFTQVKSLRGTETGEMLESMTVASFGQLSDLKSAVKDGELTLAKVRDAWLSQEVPSLANADLVICSEPFWLCPLIAVNRPGWFAGVLHMSLLNDFPFEDQGSFLSFWSDFSAMTRRSNVLLSVACRVTVEQIVEQTLVRIPYVPFLGLHVQARYNPDITRRQALLFRNNRQHMVAFRGALRLFISELDPPCPVRIRDMNDVVLALSYEEIASFHAVVLLPHGPNALRLSDLYAANVPMLVPDEPLVHKFIWASRTFALYDAEHRFRTRWKRAEQLQQEHSPADANGKRVGHPPFSPFNFVRAWAIHRLIDDKRYWYQYTEWATLPHSLRFKSIPELLQMLAQLTPFEAQKVSVRMAQHHLALVGDALSWWRATMAALIAHAEQ